MVYSLQDGARLVDQQTLISGLRSEISKQLGPYVENLNDFALIDFPHHSNVGDSAIWLGEIAYFRNVLNRRPTFVCEINNYNYEDLVRALPTGPIFLHGGGNFGDIWPPFQNFRESIIKHFHDRLIVQLPQTLHFDSEEARARAARVIEEHGNFVLFVRDHKSLEIAQSFKCKSHLVPDMAFEIGIRDRTAPVQHELLLLLRTDKESVGEDLGKLGLPRNTIVTDWLDEEDQLGLRLKKRTVATSLLDRGVMAFRKQVQRELLFENLAKSRFARGVKLLSSAKFVISDRLHVHILCLLLGIPHVVLDNSYGKLSQFRKAWTEYSDIAFKAATLEEGLDIWRRVSSNLNEKSSALVNPQY